MNSIQAIQKSFKAFSQFTVALFCTAVAALHQPPCSLAQENTPVITRLVSLGPGFMGITCTNCSETNFSYAIQYSTNLVDWRVYKVFGASTNTLDVVLTTYIPPSTFYRVQKFPTPFVPLFGMALAANSSIDLSGNGVLFDSFNSSDTNLSTGGIYDSNKRNDHGDLGVNKTLYYPDTLAIGNSRIYGKIHTGPSSQETGITIGPNGAVGNIAWHESPSIGIQPGFWLKDMNMGFYSVPAPPGGGIVPGTGIYKGTVYDRLLSISGGKYEMSSVLSGKVMVTGTNVVLWAKGGVNLSGSTGGLFFTPGASLTLFVGDTGTNIVSCDFSGKGGVNIDGMARNFQLYGMPTLRTIEVNGVPKFNGVIYAPQADFLGSASTSINHFSGALLVDKATIMGNFRVHFDEDLLVNGPPR